MKISVLENENKILKERQDNFNSSSTSQQQNLTTSEDLRKLENILTFEIEQTVRDSVEKMMKNMSATITDMELRVQSRIAFTAGILGENGQNIYSGTVKFPKVIYQVGGGYNPITGVFTAPKAGLYLIFCTNVAYNHGIIWTQVTINGSVKAGVMAYVSGSANTYQSASNLVVHQLQVGDRVWIQVHQARISSSISNLDKRQKQMESYVQTLTNSQQNDITKMNDTIIHLKNRVQSRVAFTAGIVGEVSGQHIYTGIVKFPTIIYQIGGGYNPTTGIFTAPKAGLYLIFCTTVAYDHEAFWTKIMIKDSVMAGVMAWTSSSFNVHQAASNLVVHQLHVGDRVWIEVEYGSHIYSYFPDTTFSVVMISGLE
ncbi:uncharacterized protein LOC134244706 [Saccostrea cucullata]|uniref:uncharacterized protein LOC134244706 n=1 Tax=Saccostrea cuccullata TaxID=36930 RepID=UPI002ED0E86D